MGKQAVLSVVLSLVTALGMSPSIGWGLESAAYDSTDRPVASLAVANEQPGVSGVADSVGSSESESAETPGGPSSAGVEGADAPEIPDGPDDPEGVSDPDNPEGSHNPDDPEDPGDPSDPGDPVDPEDPDNPDDPEDPETVLEEGAYFVRSAIDPSFVLDVADASIGSGANVQVWSANGTNAQRFWLSFDGESYHLQAMCSGKALDVASGKKENGTNVQQWLFEGSNVNQAWDIEENDDGTVTFIARSNQLALDVSGANASNGSNVQTWEPNGTPAQRFILEPAAAYQGSASRWVVTPGVYGVTFVNCATGRALDVDGGIAQDGRRVGTYVINGTRAQGFLGFPTDVLSSGVYRITSAVDGRSLDVADGSFSDCANVRVWDDNGTGAQRWRIEAAGDGMITVTCALTNKALDVLNYGTEAGTNVQVWQPSSGNTAQLFRPIPTGDGYYYLQSACSGLYLDVSGGGGRCGANVQVWTPNKTAAQKFRFDQSSYTRSMGDVRSGINAASGSWGLTSFGGYAPSAAVSSQIQAAVDSLRWQGYDLGFVMIDLTTGKGVSCNADGTFYSASTIKGPYVAAVCSLYPDSIASWAGTMEPTIRWSSNEGYASLRNAFGPQPMWEWSARSGVGSDIASLRYPWYTARDLAKLWTSNYEYFTTSGGWAASWFTSSSNSALYYQLGSWYTVWSKPGWIASGGAYNVSNDAGIVWGNGRPYLVAILSSYPANTARLNDVVWALEAAHNEMVG